jgi:hypothetical protein
VRLPGLVALVARFSPIFFYLSIMIGLLTPAASLYQDFFPHFLFYFSVTIGLLTPAASM